MVERDPTIPERELEFAIMGNLLPVTALVRHRDLCPTCGGNGYLGPSDGPRCPTCRGWGYLEESDADFLKRRHEAMRTTAGAQEKPLGCFERTIRDGCTDE